MWTPGYWAYGDDGYYWVPGAWVPAPYEGALWTPGYWGWASGLYVWHRGYWGPHVGYYGGVNYGFGYMGVGFAGGVWRGGVFAYNTAVVHVDVDGGWCAITSMSTAPSWSTTPSSTIGMSRSTADRAASIMGQRRGADGDERAAHGADVVPGQHMKAAMADHNSYAQVQWRASAECGGCTAAGSREPSRAIGFNNNHGAQQVNHGGNSFNEPAAWRESEHSIILRRQTNQFHPQHAESAAE